MKGKKGTLQTKNEKQALAYLSRKLRINNATLVKDIAFSGVLKVNVDRWLETGVIKPESVVPVYKPRKSKKEPVEEQRKEPNEQSGEFVIK